MAQLALHEGSVEYAIVYCALTLIRLTPLVDERVLSRVERIIKGGDSE
jgi:hypothetical protein